ncbi:TonB-dependent receptor-like protein [Dyadobacter jejuensis]|uniref:TonB-dependent receptor-like protein n=1 Tax=Dyadobacter jejuensis TaxID=1082580 RepID=A0A316ALU9_9BACT|nr:TonB-dependent receptor [Dyadobacter jejuensis]PWJ58765.1 TonB-dependent receptor-like protein [Dyadobacter jejuensis]
MYQKSLLFRAAWLALFVFSLTFSGQVMAQVTTGSLKGIITDSQNEPLPGATVVATHQSTGVKYSTLTRDDGRYNLNNLNSGIYTIAATYVGFQESQKAINVLLGEEANVNISMSDETNVLTEVVIRNDNNFNKDKQGTELNISNQQIQVMPTVSRSLADFTRLTPQVKVDGNGAVSIAGQNNRFNSIYIDGAANNDMFGLSASGTNGGQTGVSPISIDAIEQFKVVISPYDVSLSGFTGGGINAVTRSGTNNLSGSAYYYFKNENISGKRPGTDAQYDDPTFQRTKLASFNSYTTGFRLGGALVKNKLFFFVNAELQRETNPVPFTYSNYQGSITQADLNRLSDVLKSKYNYDPGSYEDVIKEVNSNKLTAKLDWNINNKHKLSVSHRYTYGESISPSTSSNSNIYFSNSGIYFPSTTNSSSAELKSTFSNTLSNRLLIGYTSVHDDRDPIGSNFPNVLINQTSTKDRINFGSEAFSSANELTSKILTFNEKLDFYTGRHNISLGLDGEFGSYYNLFVRQNYGAYTFDSFEGFLNGDLPSIYARSYSLLPGDIAGDGSKAAAEFKSARVGAFVNDRFDITDKFTLTGGIRFDLNTFPTKGFEDETFNNTYYNTIDAMYPLEGAKAGFMPSGKFTASPRLGFNYDVKGDKTLQIRGGTGIFLGRVPMVWPGGIYTNSGVIIGGVYQTGTANNLPFVADVNNQYTAEDFGKTVSVPSGELNLITKNFKLPQVWRSSLGVDKKVNGGWIFSAEGIFTKNYNDVAYENVILDKGAIKNAAGADNRMIYNPAGTAPTKIDLDPNTNGIQNPYTNIILMKNAAAKDNGYSYSVTGRVEKTFAQKLITSLAYTYGKSEVLNEVTSSQNSSQWRYMETVNGRNHMTRSRSDFDLGHRIVGFASYRFEYSKNAATTVSLFYNGQSSNPFSYTYRNSMVKDYSVSESNDLIFVPATKEQIVFKDAATADAQWAALDQFIKDDSYLSGRRGKYAERNSSRPPFVNIFDVKVLQDIYFEMGGKRHTLQLSWDVFNVGNLLNKKWGRQYYVTNDSYQLITFEGYKDAAAGDYTPLMSFSTPSGTPWNLSDGSSGNISRWTSQIGIRYIFN